MRSLFSRLRRRKAIASTVALALLAAVPVTAAVVHGGFPQEDVSLKSQDVWVTNGDKLLGGRLNHQIDELDASVQGSSENIDVLQDGGAYFLTDSSQGVVQRIDPAFSSLTDRVTIPEDSRLAYGGDTLAILAPDGRFWAVDASGRLDFDPTATKPVAKLGKDARIAVAKDGRAFGVSAKKDQLVTLERPGGEAQKTHLAASPGFQLAAVGDRAVVLSADGRTLATGDGTSVGLPAKGLRLQQSGPDAQYALVATATGLLRVPVGGGDVETVKAGLGHPVRDRGQVSAPVHLGGCDYGAWAGGGRYLYACPEKKPVSLEIDRNVQGSDLKFRVNHGVIALNDLRNGNAWVVSSHMRLVQNWAQLKPDTTEVKGHSGKKKPVRESYKSTLAHRSAHNRPPHAVDDDFGVRPGRTTILPVLDNDSDPDGDVLTVSKQPKVPSSSGVLQIIQGGRALQFTPADDISGTVSFRYSVDDGRGGTDSAQVDVTVHPFSENKAPVSSRTSTVSVEVGQTISYDVLQDWIDPDGDDAYLASATPTTEDGVQFAPDGTITFESKTGQTGSKQVDFTVSDGHLTAKGKLLVTVKPRDSMDPVAVPDYTEASISEPVVLEPLKNDESPSGAPLSLVDAEPSDGTSIPFSVDQQNGTITVSPNEDGEFYLKYTLAAGSRSTTGLIRVNVEPHEDAKAKPIAVKDVAFVRPGESTSVRVLDNDVSPSGRVLAVRGVSKDKGADDLNVELLDNAVVKITAPKVLPDEVQLSYVVSDGKGQASAAITVVPVAPLVNHQPPVAQDDTVTVRAGDIATVRVMDNDFSPDDQPFSLDKKLVSTKGAGPGASAFVSGDTVRYQAPSKPGQYEVSYGITDQYDQHARAVVTFVVTGPKGKDQAPQPSDVTIRMFAGSAVPIGVPLDGIDPDGDSVTFDGVVGDPSLGHIAGTSGKGFTYEAYPSSAGTDTFQYRVKDTHGKTALGTVRIGVVPRPDQTQPPVAVNDTVQVKPGKTASVPVLDNDSDPNGFPISVERKLSSVDKGLKASVHGKIVLVRAPKKQGAYLARYTITNGHGGSASAYVQVIVTTDAKPRYPKAVDQVVTAKQVLKHDRVRVDALDGAANPSGLVDKLKVGVTGENASRASVDKDGTVTVTPRHKRTVVTYTVTDPQTKLSGSAFIIVPPKPREDHQAQQQKKKQQQKQQHEKKKDKPHYKKTPPPHVTAGMQVVPMNGSKSWSLSDIVEAPSGRPMHLEGSSGVSAVHGDGSSAYVDPQHLQFTPKKGYRGPASITFLVNDGKEEGHKNDRVTSLVLKITVGKPDQSDVPPSFTPPSVTLQPGEKPTRIDLRDSSYHPNKKILAKLTYSDLTPSSENKVKASLSGSELSLRAPLGVQPGTTATFHVKVSNGDLSVPGTINVKVVSSSRPDALQKDAPTKRETKRGQTVKIQDAVGDKYWVNPFPDKKLTITKASAVNSPKGVTVEHTADSLTVRTASGAGIGDVNVRYTVRDATKDPKRDATGQLTVTIHDVPSKPGKPKASKPGDGSARVAFSAPSANGKKIDNYEVKWSGGSKTFANPGTKTITGLKNGKAYNFTVRAHNADGWGAWSAASNKVTPYGKPSKVSGLHIKKNSTYAKSSFHLSWNKLSGVPQTGGGKVTYHYKFKGKGWKTTTGTSVTSPSVGAGSYYFQVYATNSGGKKGPTNKSGSATVKNKPKPKPKVSVIKGANPRPGWYDCNTAWHFLGASYSSLPKGTYKVYPYINNSYVGTKKYATTLTVSGTGQSGTVSSQGCIGTHPNDTVKVVIKNSDHTYTATTRKWDSLPAHSGVDPY